MSSRRFWVGASAAVGVAIALVVYRYGWLPLSWSSPLKNVIPAVAVALFFIARTVTRHEERPGWGWVMLPALPAGALTFGIAMLLLPPPSLADLEITPHELPGFTLALPAGDVKYDEHTYPQGKYAVRTDGDGLSIVQWQPGDALDEKDLALAASVMRQGIGGQKPRSSVPTIVDGPDHKPAPTIELDGDFWVTMLPCGKRLVAVMTQGARGSEPLHRRIVRSLVCHADATQDATLGITKVAIAIELPGWTTADRSGGQLQVVSADGHAALTFDSLTARMTDDDVVKVLAPSLQASYPGATVGPLADGRAPVQVTIDSFPMFGWIRVYHCPPVSQAVMAFAETAAISEALFTQIGHARCLSPGEAAPTWPDLKVAP